MKCSNCKQNEANIKFLQIINGEKTELFLCQNCAEEMNIENFNINIPMDFSSFVSEFFDSFGEQDFITALTENNYQKCNNCGLSYDEFIKTGKLGCIDCYDVFKDRIDLITKNVQGSLEHRGKRLSNNNNNNNNQSNSNKLENFYGEDNNLNKNEQLENLKLKLKKAIREEKYEEAAVIRDEIKKLQK